MAILVLAMTLSMYSLGCIEGRLAFLAPRSCCRFESMIRFGMEKSSDQDPAAEGAAAAEEEEAFMDVCVSCRPSHNLWFISKMDSSLNLYNLYDIAK